MSFETWTVQQAKQRVTNLVKGWVQCNLDFYNGDHWQRGKGWSGPIVETTDPNYETTLLKIEGGFVSKNAVAEVTDRHVAGVIGKRPKWSVGLKRPLKEGDSPTANEQALIDEAQQLLSSWLDGQHGIAPRSPDSSEIRLAGVHEVLQMAVTSMLLTRRGVLRLFVNPSQMVQDDMGNTAVVQEPVEKSVFKILVANPSSTQAAVVVDDESMATCGVYVYKMSDGREYVELSYLNEAGETVTRILGTTKTNRRITPVSEAWILPLNGRLTLFEMQRVELIGEQVRQEQKALNKAKTMQSFNLDGAGFLERIFTNAQMPGAWEDDPENPGKEVFVPGKFKIGAATANFLQGIELTNPKTGERSITTPGIFYREPGEPGSFIKSSEDYYRGILEEVDQLHVAISGDATASGESRKQAKDDYRKSLDLTKPQVEAALRWLLETVLSMTAVFAGSPGRYDNLRITAECHIDLGAVSVEDIRVISQARQDGLLSQQTAVSRAGVDDPTAEINLINQETSTQLALLKLRAELLKALTDAQVAPEKAADLAGLYGFVGVNGNQQ